MEWKDQAVPPQVCAYVESHDGKHSESYCILDLPKMAIAAEADQPDWILLEYEDESDLAGDDEAEELARLAQDASEPDEEEEEDDEGEI